MLRDFWLKCQITAPINISTDTVVLYSHVINYRKASVKGLKINLLGLLSQVNLCLTYDKSLSQVNSASLRQL